MNDETYCGPVEVFYLAVEKDRNGYRWLVRQFGKANPVRVGNEAFALETDARKAGRPSLIAASARAAPTRWTSRLEPVGAPGRSV